MLIFVQVFPFGILYFGLLQIIKKEKEKKKKFKGLVLESHRWRQTAACTPGKWLLLRQGEQVVGGVGDVFLSHPWLCGASPALLLLASHVAAT